MCLKIILFVVVCFELNSRQHTLLSDAYQYYYLLNNGPFTYARQDGYDNNNKELNRHLSGDGRDDGLENYGFRQHSVGGRHNYGRYPYPSPGYPGSAYNEQNRPLSPENRGLNNPCCLQQDNTRFTQTPGGPNEVPPISGQLGNSFNGDKNPSSGTPNLSPNNLGNQFQGGSFEPQYGASPYPNYFNPPCVCNGSSSASYSFTFDTDNFKRQESSDRRGNVIGYLQYRNEAGLHDLSYVANDRSGFKVTGGNLAASLAGYLPPPSVRPVPSSWSMTVSSTSNPRGEGDFLRPDDGLRERETSQSYGGDDEVPFFAGVTTESEQGTK